MATVYSLGVYRGQVQATKPGGTDTPAILMIPEGVTDFTIYAISNNAAGCKIEESISSAEAINTTGAVWTSVDASLDSVGTTSVRYIMGDRTVCALRVTALVNDKTADLILVGKRA